MVDAVSHACWRTVHILVSICVTMGRARKKYLMKRIQDAQQRASGGGVTPEEQALRVLGRAPVYLLADSMNLG